MLQYETEMVYMKNFEFCKSLQVAISSLSNFTGAISSWEHFIWFEKIIPSEIQEVAECVENGVYFKKIKRNVAFYGYKNNLIAEVCLEGNVFFNANATFWKVVEIRYVKNYDESRIFLKKEWIEEKIEEKDQVLI